MNLCWLKDHHWVVKEKARNSWYNTFKCVHCRIIFKARPHEVYVGYPREGTCRRRECRK